jgi:hypothetical protein
MDESGLYLKFSFLATCVAVVGYLSALGPVRAADKCNECRDFLRLCSTAHSEAACKNDYNICMKHCRRK